MAQRSVILFFGSFNPIHRGHTAIADAVLGITGASELWFVVSPQNPFKQNSALADEKERLKMVELAIGYAKTEGKEHTGRMKACGIEMKMPKPSWTARTLRKLASLYPAYKFSILIGSDNVDNLENWKDFHHIIENYHVYVYPREGYEPVRKEFLDTLELLSSVPLQPYAATDIRNIIEAGEDIRGELAPPVWEYIKERKLYGYGK